MMKHCLSMFLCTLVFACGACATDPGAPHGPPPTEVNDAVILAMRTQTDIALDVRRVEQFEQLLRAARSVVPEEVAALHARPDGDYRTVHMYATGEISAAFDQGQLRTGNAKLDDVLARFELTSVRMLSPSTPQHPTTLYSLKFNGLLQIARLATAIQDLHIAEIANAFPTNSYGYADDIRATQTGADWTFTFIHGEGDCPSGCITRIKTHVLVDANGQAYFLGRSN